MSPDSTGLLRKRAHVHVLFTLMMTTSYDEKVESYSYNSSNISRNGSYTTYGPYKIETAALCTGIILIVVPSVLPVLVIIIVVTMLQSFQS